MEIALSDVTHLILGLPWLGYDQYIPAVEIKKAAKPFVVHYSGNTSKSQFDHNDVNDYLFFVSDTGSKGTFAWGLFETFNLLDDVGV
ncbi:unnamed protein product [Clavelina lepadiformis]|uniref:Uncharacterized protein n=1 Tax=Clavelina lepadiformis TaxID=159417 RepID=A0ABP0G1Z7_CLALP